LRIPLEEVCGGDTLSFSNFVTFVVGLNNVLLATGNGYSQIVGSSLDNDGCNGGEEMDNCNTHSNYCILMNENGLDAGYAVVKECTDRVQQRAGYHQKFLSFVWLESRYTN
jgi:hypothetical protein